MNSNYEKRTMLKKLIPLWRGINFTRKLILNIVFFVLLYYVLSWLMQDDRPSVPQSAVLVVTPYGNVVDQLTGVSLLNSAQKIVGLSGSETLLKDMLDAIHSAKDDDRIKALLLNLNYIGGIGLTKLQDLAGAIEDFKQSGKKVIATADSYGRNSYYLAAHADKIYIHHLGWAVLQGYSRYGRYYKDMLDRLEVDVNIFRVGKYKSAVEPFLRDDMSEAAREANLRWVGALWDSWLNDVAAARKIKKEKINHYIDNFNQYLEKTSGDAAQAAHQAGLVDVVATREELRTCLTGISGKDNVTGSFKRIGFYTYLNALSHDRWGDAIGGDVVAVVVAKGGIFNGTQPPGKIGGDSTAALIRRARNNDRVKAIVLKVDSGGGSAMASEVIHNELELARKQGKPVVASMGSVAASGGYWISMASDEVWAYPATITGSIGIFAMYPTFQRTLKKFLGVQVDGIGTNKMSGAFRTDLKIKPFAAQAIQTIINREYRRFVSRVAESRKMKPEKINELAQGRVWIGSDAHRLGLIDKMGTFKDALDSAAKMAKLGTDYRVKYIRNLPSFRQRMISQFIARVSGRSGGNHVGEKSGLQLNPYADIVKSLVDQLAILSQFNDPNGMYAFWPDNVNF